MILRKPEDRKLLVNALEEQIGFLSLDVRHQKLLDIFALSQGFEAGENEFPGYLEENPIYVEVSHAAQFFADKVNATAIKNELSEVFSPCMFENIVKRFDRYPVVAGFDECVLIDIDYETATVSEPQIVPRSEYGQKSWGTHYGTSYSVFIDFQISLEEFESLKFELQPHLRILESAFQNLKDAKVINQAQDAVEQIVEECLDNLSNYCVRTSCEYFGDGFPDFEDLYRDESTKIVWEGKVFLSHETTDRDLRNIVAIEILHNDLMKDEHLYRDLKDYRDTCREHYLNSL
ncbi:hypothetical protein A3743_20475 [Oleiphilus sp. HI0072]|nr:hypothetical protein A3743_20475 [Oleiphilus sp. HI0072]